MKDTLYIIQRNDLRGFENKVQIYQNVILSKKLAMNPKDDLSKPN